MTDHYIVVTYNQASHMPDLDVACLYDNLDDAIFARDLMRADTKQVGRGELHEIWRAEPLDEDEPGGGT